MLSAKRHSSGNGIESRRARTSCQGRGIADAGVQAVQLRRAGETLCAMLNGGGGHVLIGVTDSGAIIGQQVSDRTLQDVAAKLTEFEPPPPIRSERVSLTGTLEVIVLGA